MSLDSIHKQLEDFKERKRQEAAWEKAVEERRAANKSSYDLNVTFNPTPKKRFKTVILPHGRD